MSGVKQPDDSQSARTATEHLLALGKIATGFARVQRMPRYPDGARETDAEHSYHLALSAVELAATFLPDLNTGLVAQFSLVHDLPELYTGDVSTFNISESDRTKKEQAEEASLKRLLHELPPHTAALLERYEKQEDAEARFVRFVDKVMPPIINLVAEGATTLKEDYDIESLSALHEIQGRQASRLQEMFPEFPFVQSIWDMVIADREQNLFPDSKG